MRIGTITTKDRVYIDSQDLLNALESWKPGLDAKQTAVVVAIEKTIEKALKHVK